MEYPNWFKQTAEHNFEKFLKPYAGKEDLRFMQIGAFTGDASVWMCENVLTHFTSTLLDIDTWEGSKEEAHETMDFKDVQEVYEEKIAPFKRVVRLKMTSGQYFAGDNKGGFDFIYIDGDHTASAVIDDAVMAWPLLKSGGILAFDDYTWNHPGGELYTPRPSINFFIWSKQNELEVIEASNQLWVKKK